MVWGAILNARHYGSEVFKTTLLLLLPDLPEVIFPQDNTRPHIANMTLNFLTENNVNLLLWSPRSGT